ncbi:hypothetical protein N7489_006206 [Penicillium chrysogenum]|uniref:uncharacterized protein n=1 Tax=Penicillium chrysogenum TaxID=5076 RepID=UPI002384BB50|nr:uncharacterized protein N7489_006206 [Penicillium chrysogenum]KAJ5236115.1 hypothetical protein N7489_006206 [Penicillium chrysogenum]KAJ5276055.1 hypothetical protein N7524_002208 [Penicillium chrysogenum]
MGQFEHFFPIENLTEAGKGYFNYALCQSDRMRPYQLDNPIEEGLRGGYLSDDVTVNLLANASGIFATLEYSWIPSYNNYTLQWFYQDLLEGIFLVFGEKYNVRPHWNKMLFNDGTYASNIYPKINSWLDIQEQMDPHCQFVNDFLAESLGTERCMSLFQ